MGFLRAIGDERLVQVVREEVVHHRPPVVRDRDAVHRDVEPRPGVAEYVGRNVELPRAWRVESLPIRIGRRPIVRVSRVLTDGTTTEPAPSPSRGGRANRSWLCLLALRKSGSDCRYIASESTPCQAFSGRDAQLRIRKLERYVRGTAARARFLDGSERIGTPVVRSAHGRVFSCRAHHPHRRPIWWVTVNGSFSLLDHENQRPDLGCDFENRGYTVSLNLTPAGGKRLSANLDYSRADLTSDILFIFPQLLTSDRSLYIEDSHFGNLSLEFGAFRDVRFSLGYSILSTSGSRPLNYHQPHAGVVIPITRGIAWTTEWRYFDYNE